MSNKRDWNELRSLIDNNTNVTTPWVPTVTVLELLDERDRLVEFLRAERETHDEVRNNLANLTNRQQRAIQVLQLALETWNPGAVQKAERIQRGEE